MKRASPFIWTPKQQVNPKIDFRRIIRDGPVRRDDGVNRWFMFRKCFELQEAEIQNTKMNANIFVDGRYALHINDEYIARGPARCNPYYARYDTHNVTKLLKPGINVIAVLVHVYGIDTSSYQRAVNYWQSAFGDGGLYFDLSIGDTANARHITADESWRCLQSQAWTQDTPKAGWGQGYVEEHDARKVPLGWLSRNFDDSNWDLAQIMQTASDPVDIEKGFHPTQPFPTLIPRGMRLLSEEARSPQKIVASFGLVSDDTLPIDRRIYDEKTTDLPSSAISNGSALLVDDESWTNIRTYPGVDTGILIAFEAIHAAYANIELDAQGGEIIEIAVSETLPGEYTKGLEDTPRLARDTFMDCAHVFRYTAKKGLQSFEKFEWTAIKYLQLVVRNAPDGLRIRHIGSTYTAYPIEEQGTFTCSDEFLNRLWKVGAYTIAQCSHDAWEDCPGREKRQWLGDGTVRYLASFACFGTSTNELDKNFLLQCQESQRTDGLLQMFAPGDHHYQGMIIPDYSLYWVLTAWDYYLHTADIETVAEIFPTIEKILSWFLRQEDSNGLLADLPYWHFIEWANTVRTGESATINAMYAGALSCASRLARFLDYPGAEQRYSARSKKTARALNERHWNASLGLYVDSVDPTTGKQQPGISQHANAAMILWNIAPQEHWSSIATAITNKSLTRLSSVFPVAEGDPDFQRDKHIVKANTFFAHFVYTALAKAGHYDLALSSVRDHYHNMISKGAETLWESFEPTASLCHAFSATPVYQLSSNSLGIRPLEPGFKSFSLAIQTGGLSSAAGIYPTPLGGISVNWRVQEKHLEVTIVVPQNTECHVLNPPGYSSFKGERYLLAGKHQLTFTQA